MSVSLTTSTMAKNPAILNAGAEFVSKFLARQAPVEVNKLGNGVKVATKDSGANGFATVGVHTRSGSRFEMENNNGASALVQRAAWNGTQNMSANEFRSKLQSIGGAVSFAQGRERQSTTIDCMSGDVPTAIELLHEATANPKMDAAAVDAARSLAIDQLKENENDISATVMHNLFGQAYETTRRDQPGAGLGLNPYGDGDNLKGLSAEDIAAFHKRFVANPSTISLVATGDINSAKVLEEAEKRFGAMPNGKGEPSIDKRYTGGSARIDCGKPAPPYTQHVALGWEICGANGADVIPLQLLAQVFGNYDRHHNDLTSNWAILFNLERNSTQMGKQPLEEVRTFFDTFSDTGMMGFYFTHNVGETAEEATHYHIALQAEWVRYCMRLMPYQVEVGKNLLKSKLLFKHDGTNATNADIGEQLVTTGTVTPVEQAFARIDDLTTQQVSDTINHYYYDREPVMSSYGNYYNLPNWLNARRNMMRWRY